MRAMVHAWHTLQGGVPGPSRQVGPIEGGENAQHAPDNLYIIKHHAKVDDDKKVENIVEPGTVTVQLGARCARGTRPQMFCPLARSAQT